MEEDIELEIHKLRSRLIELEKRLDNPSHWTSGEINLFQSQIKIAKNKISQLLHRDIG